MARRMSVILLTCGLFGGGVCVSGERPGPPGTVTVRLRDRSQIVGKILGLQDGAYRVQTQSLGIVKVPADRIDSIVFDRPGEGKLGPREGGSPGRAPTRSSTDAAGAPTSLFDLDAVFRGLLGNASVMRKIEKLGSDPQIQAILDDRDIMKAIEERDFMSLLRNPRIQSLADNPAIKEITDGVTNGK